MQNIARFFLSYLVLAIFTLAVYTFMNNFWTTAIIVGLAGVVWENKRKDIGLAMAKGYVDGQMIAMGGGSWREKLGKAKEGLEENKKKE